jgi:glucose-1-phosphate cytidylyltransferase
MKVVIFAGGIGSRITEESHLRPKPMIEIGGKPILWHIMKIYSSQGFNDFIICLGYKGYLIKEYFFNYYMHNSDVTIELKNNKVHVHDSKSEDIKVTLIDTGLETKTAGRLKWVEKHLNGEDFMLSYGDGVANINLASLLEFHHAHGKLATVTAVKPAGRFGVMQLNPDDNKVDVFNEKLPGDENWINGGYFVLKNDVFSYLPANAEALMWEESALPSLAAAGQLMAYQHDGFWKCMDAMRDKIELEELWHLGRPEWKIW